MAAKVRQKDGACWVVVHHAGRRTMRRIGADKRTAQRVAHELNAKIALGKFDPDARRSRRAHPVDRALWDWHAAYRPTFSASFEACSAGYIANHLVPFFGTKDLRDLRDADVLSFIQTKLDSGLKPPTIKNQLSVLRRVLNLKQREGLINRHPCQHFGELMQRVARREASEVPQVDAWSRDEVAALLQLARDHEAGFYPLLAFLLQTGCRKGEALGLRWADVDFSGDRIHIRRAVVHGKLTTPKSGKARSVVLSSPLAQVLHDLHDERRREALRRGWRDVPEVIFCDQRGGNCDERNLHRTWNRLRRRAAKEGVRPLRLHDARHTFASQALAAGKSVRWVAAQLGHANPELTLRVYAHVLREEEEDLSFLDYESRAASGGAKRHPDGTKLSVVGNARRSLAVTPRRLSRSLEHETGLEPATTTLATWSSTN